MRGSSTSCASSPGISWVGGSGGMWGRVGGMWYRGGMGRGLSYMWGRVRGGRIMGDNMGGDYTSPLFAHT